METWKSCQHYYFFFGFLSSVLVLIMSVLPKKLCDSCSWPGCCPLIPPPPQLVHVHHSITTGVPSTCSIKKILFFNWKLLNVWSQTLSQFWILKGESWQLSRLDHTRSTSQLFERKEGRKGISLLFLSLSLWRACSQAQVLVATNCLGLLVCLHLQLQGCIKTQEIIQIKYLYSELFSDIPFEIEYYSKCL